MRTLVIFITRARYNNLLLLLLLRTLRKRSRRRRPLQSCKHIIYEDNISRTQERCVGTYTYSGPYLDPTHTRTGWIGQPPILDRLEVVTDNGDVDTLGQATP